jgi:hypothetical protein
LNILFLHIKIKKKIKIKELEEDLVELQKKLKDLDKTLEKNASNSSNANSTILTDKRKLEQQAKEEILKEADIIICTLNFSGNQVLDCLKPERNNGQPVFTTIIIDEVSTLFIFNI